MRNPGNSHCRVIHYSVSLVLSITIGCSDSDPQPVEPIHYLSENTNGSHTLVEVEPESGVILETNLWEELGMTSKGRVTITDNYYNVLVEGFGSYSMYSYDLRSKSKVISKEIYSVPDGEILKSSTRSDHRIIIGTASSEATNRLTLIDTDLNHIVKLFVSDKPIQGIEIMEDDLFLMEGFGSEYTMTSINLVTGQVTNTMALPYSPQILLLPTHIIALYPNNLNVYDYDMQLEQSSSHDLNSFNIGLTKVNSKDNLFVTDFYYDEASTMISAPVVYDMNNMSVMAGGGDFFCQAFAQIQDEFPGATLVDYAVSLSSKSIVIGYGVPIDHQGGFAYRLRQINFKGSVTIDMAVERSPDHLFFR